MMDKNNAHSTINSQVSPHAQDIVNILKDHSIIRIYPEGKKLNLLQNGDFITYLIIKGNVSLYRGNDNLNMFTMTSPALAGIGNSPDSFIEGYLKTLCPCQIGTILSSQARDLIVKNNAWELFSKHLLVASKKIFVFSQRISTPNAYSVIRYQLFELMSEDINMRSNITIANYIMNKVPLSRSRIMGIISDLKAGGYITTDRGKLVKIINLPEKY
ncbi:MAG: helix-turn-helix domain-containing protein [Enterobacterales bacterium]|uniref:helix-turn-helix domain-containing protein n=1 Tax=Serratia sp. (in: enterobacteria) TaxID=616 RepID=UPI003F41481E